MLTNAFAQTGLKFAIIAQCGGDGCEYYESAERWRWCREEKGSAGGGKQVERSNSTSWTTCSADREPEFEICGGVTNQSGTSTIAVVIIVKSISCGLNFSHFREHVRVLSRVWNFESVLRSRDGEVRRRLVYFFPFMSHDE